MAAMSGPKLFAPSAERNKDPILQVLQKHLPSKGHVVEIASGSGQHVAHFARAFPPSLTWQPTEYAGHPGPLAAAQDVAPVLASITAYTEDLPNVLPPCELDAAAEDWNLPPSPNEDPLVGVLATNVTHISPYNVTQGLLKGAAKLLQSEGHLIIYGPFKVGGEAKPESNASFDATLQKQDPSWGLRDMEAVQKLAESHGLTCKEVHEMPANNLMLVFKKP